MTKLSFYGIRRLENKWFCSFLTQRAHYVSISGFLLDTKFVQCGLPQGSTLVPWLFLLYINDLKNSFKHCTIRHFVDNANLLYAIKNIQNIEQIMNAELRRLVSWLAASRLSLSESKTQLTLFHSTRQHHHAISSIILYNFLLEPVKLAIYLGIKIEENY